MTEIFYIPKRFSDVDEFSQWETELGWEIESAQLSAGSGGVVFDHIAFPEMLVGRFGSLGVMQNSFAVPPGIVVILVCRSMLPVFWSGHELQPDVIPIIRSGPEHVSRIPAGWDSYEFMISESLVRRSELLPSQLLDDPVRVEDSWLRAPLSQLSRFVNELDTIFGLRQQNGGPLAQERPWEVFDRVLTGLSQLIATSTGPGETHRLRRTRRPDLVRASVDLMRQHLANGMTVDELCQELGVSYRVLNYAFQDAYRISPGRFLHTLRLQRARRLLKLADTTVTAAASAVGIYELGRFSMHYRTHFGELPSETKRNGNGTTATNTSATDPGDPRGNGAPRRNGQWSAGG